MKFFKFLSKNLPIEKSFFRVAKWGLCPMGQFPQMTSSTFRNINSAIHVLYLLTGTLSQFWYGSRYIDKDLQDALDAVCPAVAALVSLIKMVLIIWYGKDVAKLIKHIKDILLEEIKDEEKNRIAMEYASTGNMLAFMVFASGETAVLFYSLRPLVGNLARVLMGQSYNFDETPLRVVLPDGALRLPWYPLTYAHACYLAQVIVTACSGVDGIFISVCCYAAALMKMLRLDIKSALHQFRNKKKLTKEEYQVCSHLFGRIIDRHNEIIYLVKEFTRQFTCIILAYFVTSSILLGASIFQILLYPGLRSIVYATYPMFIMCDLYVYCYGASVILETSFDLGMAAYFAEWYTCDTRIQGMVLVIINQSQRPLTMAVPFFSPSMETFASIVRTAGTVITVAKSAVL